MISTQIKNDITLRLVKKCRQGYPPLYLLDGHNTAGVSGAPAWAYSDDSSRVELIAIIGSYLSNAQKKIPRLRLRDPNPPTHTVYEIFE